MPVNTVFPVPGRGFHPGPFRRRWRGWLRQHKSVKQLFQHHFVISFCYSLANFDLILCLEKSEMVRYPDVAQRTLLLFDEVSRKRELFEKEQQTGSTASSGGSKQVQLSQTTLISVTAPTYYISTWHFQEMLGFTSGVSDRINRWLSRTKQPGSSHIPVVSVSA